MGDGRLWLLLGIGLVWGDGRGGALEVRRRGEGTLEILSVWGQLMSGGVLQGHDSQSFPGSLRALARRSIVFDERIP